MAFKFLHGAVLVDTITSFRGVCIGRADYITGCNQYLLQPQVLHENSPIPSLWYDEARLEQDPVPLVTVQQDDGARPGADRPAPRK